MFTLLVASSAPTALAFLVAAVAFSGLIYLYRVRTHGGDLAATMSLLHKHEQIGGGEEAAR